MSKAVKTIAAVAAVAAAAYYGGPFIAASGAAPAGTTTATTAATTASTTAATASTSAAVGAKAAAASEGLLSAKAISTVGMASQAVSGAMQLQANAEARDAEKRQAEITAKMNEAEAQKARIQMIRQQRVLAGRTEATAASRGFSPSGTSSIVTGLGSLNTQTAVATADIAGRSEAARDVGQAQSDLYSAMNSAQGWQSFGTMGASLARSDVAGSVSTGLKNIFA